MRSRGQGDSFGLTHQLDPLLRGEPATSHKNDHPSVSYSNGR